MRLTATGAAILFGGLMAGSASAQATRTWVSGVGDDANPCSRTAPCKTFAGAIAKTAAGGEINCLDPGGFGAVAITKSLTISCQYTEGGALAGGNGIVVNAGPNDVVYLRGLDIFGVNPPGNGVRFVSGGALHVEDSVIRRFNGPNSRGIAFQPNGASQLYISNTVIADNGNGASGGGILIQPTGAGGSVRAVLRNVRIQNNANDGIRVDTGGNSSAAGISVTIDDSQIAGNTVGLSVSTPAGTTSANVMVSGSTIANNSSRGILAAGSTTIIRIADSSIHGNGAGVVAGSGAAVNSYGNNRLDGNTPDGSFSAVIAQE